MRQPPKEQAGFTLIEVMVAMLVFMAALLGLVALQRASIAGTNKGREHTAAVNIAKFVMTQLENEAAAWPLTMSIAEGSDFPMLSLGLDNPGRWNVLADENGTPVADDFRIDSYMQHSERSFYTANVDSAPFCVHYLISPIGPNQELLQARVRVVWPKWKQYVIESDDDPGVWNECNWPGYDDPDVLEARLKYSDIVELTSVLSREFTSEL